MKPLKEAIEQTAELGRKLIKETPNLTNVDFTLDGYSTDEMAAYARQNNTMSPEFKPSLSRFTMGVCPGIGSDVFIHVRSVEVKAKVVYE